MRPSEALANNRDRVLEIISHYPFSNPRVFGSVARGEDTEESDLDILVEPGQGASYFDVFTLEDKLGEILGIKVELHTLREFRPKSRTRIEMELKPL